MNDDKEAQDTQKSLVKGRVSSSEGTWLSGARIVCGGVPAVALADGSYTLTGLTSGVYLLEAGLEGYSTIRRSVSVPEKGELELNLVLPKEVGEAKIHGTLIDDETSQPIRTGMVVLILPIANRYSPVDEKGHYEFPELVAGTYTLHTSVPGYEDLRVKVTASNEQEVKHDFSCRQVRTEEPPWG